MCNAWNHDNNCDCGFGPPYRWKIKPSPPESWDIMSLQDIASYKHHLKSLLSSKTEIDKELNRYQRAGYPYPKETWSSLSDKEKDDFKNKFLDFVSYLFNRYKIDIKEEEYIDKEIDIPIFILCRPAVNKSKVMFEIEKKTTKKVTWSVKIMGFGTGRNQVFNLISKGKFSSENGRGKLVHLPVTFRLTKLKLYQKNKKPRSILKGEPSPKYENVTINEGVKPLNKYFSPDSYKKINCPQEYPLEKVNSSNISEYSIQWDSETEKEFSSGVKAFNLEGICNAKIRRKTTMILTFYLPGGHRYRMFPIKKPDGLVWELVSCK